MNRTRDSGNSSADAPSRTTDAAAAAPHDAELIAAIAQRDRQALRVLYLRHARAVQGFALRMTHDRGTAEEVTDDTFLAIWDGAARYRGESRPSTWIFGIAYRRALKALEYRSARLPLAANHCQAQDIEDASDDAAQAETADWVESGLRALSAEHRAVLELAYYVGLSCEEMAVAVDCPVGTIKSRLFHARERMREQLERRAAAGRIASDSR
jgi:RNA polymerase sigma-70 factor, ECF subfamily